MITVEEIARRCERIEGHLDARQDPVTVLAYANGAQVDVEVVGYFGGVQRFRITVEEVTG